MRKFIGAMTILVWVVAYIAVVAVIGDRVTKEPIWIQLIFFPIAGLAWVLPIKPRSSGSTAPRATTIG